MSPTVRKALVGLALAGGIAGVGAGLAYAQTSTTTPPSTSPPTTTAPDRSAPANPAPDDSDSGRRHCDHDRSGGTGDTGDTSNQTSPTAAEI